ncbi:UDP-glucuronosyltransferase 1-6 [Triplophysa tibetana]|uniref:glucuronosyltransferase n=1 Tax=Triplophysa tibetana TaxID=1572043 RepID=A0A5A9NDB9_9TELE|nr:UDP-glucuronosyltransferase 1-6 [Triplophysa tibetana]
MFRHEGSKMRWTFAAFMGHFILAVASLEETTRSGASGWTGKLLVVPMDGSHWTGVKAVAEEMGRRGHQVLVVIPEVSVRLGPGKHFTTRTFPVPYGQEELDELQARNAEASRKLPFLERIPTRISNMKRFVKFQTTTAESLLFNQELVDYLRKQNFDAVLTSPAVPTGAILAYNLSLPAVYMLRGLPCRLDSIATACPDPPSYVPRFFTKSTDRMSFGERVVNVLVSCLEPVLCKLSYWTVENMASRFLQRDVSLADILRTGAIWLMRFDFTLEFPKPLMPNMVLVAGINCGVKNPLTKNHDEKSGWTGKLLVVPMDGSHWTGVKAVAEEMGRKGHMVIVLIPEVSMRLGPGKHYITKMFPVSYSRDFFDQVMADYSNLVTTSPGSLLETVVSKVDQVKKLFKVFASTGESLFKNQELIDFIREQNFDAVLTDPVLPIGAVLAYNLSVPAVYMLRGMPVWS